MTIFDVVDKGNDIELESTSDLSTAMCFVDVNYLINNNVNVNSIHCRISGASHGYINRVKNKREGEFIDFIRQEFTELANSATYFMINAERVIYTGSAEVEGEGFVQFLIAENRDSKEGYLILEIIGGKTVSVLKVKDIKDYRYTENIK